MAVTRLQATRNGWAGGRCNATISAMGSQGGCGERGEATGSHKGATEKPTGAMEIHKEFHREATRKPWEVTGDHGGLREAMRRSLGIPKPTSRLRISRGHTLTHL